MSNPVKANKPGYGCHLLQVQGLESPIHSNYQNIILCVNITLLEDRG